MRIVIAEDLLLLRDGLVRMLTDVGHEVGAAVGNADDLLVAVREQQPDLSIVDVRLPPGFRDEGIRAALKLRKDSATPVLILSQYVERTYAAELLADGKGAVRNTSGTSSANSACHRRTTVTDGCRPCSPISTDDP